MNYNTFENNTIIEPSTLQTIINGKSYTYIEIEAILGMQPKKRKNIFTIKQRKVLFYSFLITSTFIIFMLLINWIINRNNFIHVYRWNILFCLYSHIKFICLFQDYLKIIWNYRVLWRLFSYLDNQGIYGKENDPLSLFSHLLLAKFQLLKNVRGTLILDHPCSRRMGLLEFHLKFISLDRNKSIYPKLYAALSIKTVSFKSLARTLRSLMWTPSSETTHFSRNRLAVIIFFKGSRFSIT
jgi:hypothetical protein